MIRLLADGVLVSWGAVVVWLLLPVPGTWLALALWGLVRYAFYLRHPLARRMKEAIAAKDDEIHRLKARVLDETDARREAESKRN